jgi:hypothetical protein
MPAFDALNALVLALAGSVWVYPVVFALVVVDGFFPPFPSETVVVALGALAVSAGAPSLGWLIGVVTFFFNDTATTAFLTLPRILPLRVALPRWPARVFVPGRGQDKVIEGIETGHDLRLEKPRHCPRHPLGRSSGPMG